MGRLLNNQHLWINLYGFITTRVVFASKRMLLVHHKDFLPTTLKSFLICEYLCHCDTKNVE